MFCSAVTVLLWLSPVLVPPQTAEDVLRAVVWMHAPLESPPADSVFVTTGTRSESVADQPITTVYTRVRKGEDMFIEIERVTLAGQTMQTVTRFDGRVGWISMSDGKAKNSREMNQEEIRALQRRKALAAVTQPHLILKSKNTRLARLKDERLNGTSVYVVRVDGAEASVLYVDQKSLLVVKVAVLEPGPDGKVAYEQRYSDFRRTASGMIGMKAEVGAEGTTEVINIIDSIELKSAKDFPDEVFRKPKQ